MLQICVYQTHSCLVTHSTSQVLVSSILIFRNTLASFFGGLIFTFIINTIDPNQKPNVWSGSALFVRVHVALFVKVLFLLKSLSGVLSINGLMMWSTPLKVLSIYLAFFITNILNSFNMLNVGICSQYYSFHSYCFIKINRYSCRQGNSLKIYFFLLWLLRSVQKG